MIRYFTSWYDEKNDARRAELITCLRNCCESPDIDVVYVLCESPTPIMHEKLKEIPVTTRPTYNDFFLLANGMSNEDDVVIISNIDIYPDKHMRPLFERLEKNQSWVLSRWDIRPNGEPPVHLRRRDSQDSWMFRAPIRKINGNFCLGYPGCDNSIACWIDQAGYEISNPSNDVRFLHLHLTELRNYTTANMVKSPYLLVEPSSIEDKTSHKHMVSWQPTAQNPLTPHI